jgi:hypothetical protein
VEGDSSALRDVDAEKSAVPAPGVPARDASSCRALSLRALLRGLAEPLASAELCKPDAVQSEARSFAVALELMAPALLILLFLPTQMETQMSKRFEPHLVAAGLEAPPDAAL